MLRLHPDPKMDSDPGADSDPAWIRIHAIPIPALFDVIPAPDLDPQRNGIVTPLLGTSVTVSGVSLYPTLFSIE